MNRKIAMVVLNNQANDAAVLVVSLMLNKPDIPVAQTGPSGFAW
jgi:hypothetical protein